MILHVCSTKRLAEDFQSLLHPGGAGVSSKLLCFTSVNEPHRDAAASADALSHAGWCKLLLLQCFLLLLLLLLFLQNCYLKIAPWRVTLRLWTASVWQRAAYCCFHWLVARKKRAQTQEDWNSQNKSRPVLFKLLLCWLTFPTNKRRTSSGLIYKYPLDSTCRCLRVRTHSPPTPRPRHLKLTWPQSHVFNCRHCPSTHAMSCDLHYNRWRHI